MRSRKQNWGAWLVLLASGAAIQTAHATSELLVGTVPGYSEGQYGTSSTTTIEYLPFYLKYRDDDLSLKVTVPWISVESAGAVVSGGMVIAHPGRGGMNGTGSASATTTTESGLGDVWLEGRYRLHGQGSAPDVVPYAKAKLGTASRSNGLGTGENDYEAGAGLEWMIGRNLFPFAQAGYRVVGQPPGVTVHNIATYEGGLMVNTGGRDFVTLMAAGNQAAISGQSDVLDFIGAWKHAITATTDIQAYFDKGLTNGSPDYAFGVGLETRL